MHISSNDIRRGLQEGEFFPVFQPQVELRTGKLVGFEVLARWRRKRLGEISPEIFIPAVEKSGLIDRLTQVILRKTLASALLKGNNLTLAINASAGQLLNSQVPELLAAVFAEYGCALNRLIIEVTESALLEDLEQAQGTARALKELGCKLSLDDFGTGYSSLKHLHALPFDELKIDKAFVGSMLQNRQSRKIVASVIGLGQSLGLNTVAEGVESYEQVKALLWLGCNSGQGWLYGRPAVAEEALRFLADSDSGVTVALPDLPVDEESILAGLDGIPTQRLAQLQAIYDGSPLGMCFIDRGLHYVSVNRRLAEMNGVPVAAHLGRRVDEVIPAIFPAVEPFLLKALEGEATRGAEYTKPSWNGNGQRQTVRAYYQPIHEETGEMLGVSVALMDVTEQKRLEHLLREKEEHYRHILSLHPGVHWILDPDGKVIEAGAGWEVLTGRRLEDALGDGWLRMVHPDDLATAKDGIRITLESGQPPTTEFRLMRRDGHWTRVRVRGLPRRGLSGEAICFYGALEVQDDSTRMDGVD